MVLDCSLNSKQFPSRCNDNIEILRIEEKREMLPRVIAAKPPDLLMNFRL